MESENSEHSNDQSLAETYSFAFEINPRNYSVDAKTLKMFANNEGALLSRVSNRSQTYKLHYNEPLQLANIGFAIGNYIISKS